MCIESVQCCCKRTDIKPKIMFLLSYLEKIRSKFKKEINHENIKIAFPVYSQRKKERKKERTTEKKIEEKHR